MASETMHRIVELIESSAQSRPSPIEFEMAYQLRVAMDRIRFAIKHTEQFGPHTDKMWEAGIQLPRGPSAARSGRSPVSGAVRSGFRIAVRE